MGASEAIPVLLLHAAVVYVAKVVCRSGSRRVGCFLVRIPSGRYCCLQKRKPAGGMLSCKNSKWKILMSSRHGEVVCLVGYLSTSARKHAQCPGINRIVHVKLLTVVKEACHIDLRLLWM